MTDRRNIIDAIVAEHLTPALTSNGFTRQKRIFRLDADNGDAVVVGVQTSSGSRKELAKFYINVALVPLPWLKWLRKSEDPVRLTGPGDAEGAVETRVRDSASGSWAPDIWMCAAQDIDARGQSAAEATTATVADFIPLLDRTEFLHRLEERAPLPGICPEIATKAILYLDARRLGEARTTIEEIASYQPDSTFVTWARHQLSIQSSAS